MEMPLFPGDLVGFIHFSPDFSSSPSPSCCSVQGDQRVLDRLEQRQLHIQQGTPQKKRIHQTSAYDGYKMVIWCLYLYHIWCLYDVLIIFNMFIIHFEWTCGCMFNDTIRCIHSSMSYPVKVHCHVQLPEGSLLSRYVLVLMTFPR